MAGLQVPEGRLRRSLGVWSVGRLQHPQQLHHPADQQSLVVDLHPGAGGGGEDDVVAGLDRHLDPGRFPPVHPFPHSQDDPLLGRGLGGAGRDDQAGLPHSVGFELLDYDLVEERSELVAGHRGRVEAEGPGAPWPA